MNEKPNLSKLKFTVPPPPQESKITKVAKFKVLYQILTRINQIASRID